MEEPWRNSGLFLYACRGEGRISPPDSLGIRSPFVQVYFAQQAKEG